MREILITLSYHNITIIFRVPLHQSLDCCSRPSPFAPETSTGHFCNIMYEICVYDLRNICNPRNRVFCPLTPASTALRYWCCVLMMHSGVPFLNVNVHQIPMGFWASFWVVKRIFNFPAKQVPILQRNSQTRKSWLGSTRSRAPKAAKKRM